MDMQDYSPPEKLWQHEDPNNTGMYRFLKAAERYTGRRFKDYADLYAWSCNETSDFWLCCFHYFPLVYWGKLPKHAYDQNVRLDQVPKWFPGIKVNFAENILFVGRRDGTPTKSPGKEDDKIACTSIREGQLEPSSQLTWSELRDQVGCLSQAMRAHGVRKGDRIALVASNCIKSLLVFLATAAIGAIFSSFSTDMGTTAILDRLRQIGPRLVFIEDTSIYRQKKVDIRQKMQEIADDLASQPDFLGVISQPRFPGYPASVSGFRRIQSWESFLSKAQSNDLVFEQTCFSDPMIILYSSGTTGKPKCIVHSIGGLVLSGHKESSLHRAVTSSSAQMQFTTTAWMMYMSSVQLLLVGARMVMYDGHPFEPDHTRLLKIVADHGVTHLGISPRFLSTLRAQNIIPKSVADLSRLQMVTSTGMVLSEALFTWFYDSFLSTTHLANISGGTDIAAAFGTANPLLPVYRGGCQCIALGMAVSAFTEVDTTSDGKSKGRPVEAGTPGELVCTKPFPTMPLYFWGDTAAGEKYFNSYFAKYSNVWTHGDLIMFNPRARHPHHVVFLGRADGVLNPSGVRFGSAEIYNVIEQYFSGSVADSVCVGQQRGQDEDEGVMLFLLMETGHRFNRALVERVKHTIRQELSPRHVPRYVFETPEIPVTANQKKVEVVVKRIVSGHPVQVSEALANPKSLDYYRQFAHDEFLKGAEKARL